MNVRWDFHLWPLGLKEKLETLKHPKHLHAYDSESHAKQTQCRVVRFLLSEQPKTLCWLRLHQHHLQITTRTTVSTLLITIITFLPSNHNPIPTNSRTRTIHERLSPTATSTTLVTLSLFFTILTATIVADSITIVAFLTPSEQIVPANCWTHTTGKRPGPAITWAAVITVSFSDTCWAASVMALDITIVTLLLYCLYSISADTHTRTIDSRQVPSSTDACDVTRLYDTSGRASICINGVAIITLLTAYSNWITTNRWTESTDTGQNPARTVASDIARLNLADRRASIIVDEISVIALLATSHPSIATYRSAQTINYRKVPPITRANRRTVLYDAQWWTPIATIDIRIVALLICDHQSISANRRTQIIYHWKFVTSARTVLTACFYSACGWASVVAQIVSVVALLCWHLESVPTLSAARAIQHRQIPSRTRAILSTCLYFTQRRASVSSNRIAIITLLSPDFNTISTYSGTAAINFRQVKSAACATGRTGLYHTGCPVNHIPSGTCLT